jgi:prepilin-type N-terminal cleavage/methylation domain-containing protein
MIVIKMHKNENGFTLLEIIAVLVILGILTAVAVSRAVNVGPELSTGADTLKMHLRYAQTLAMNSNPNSGTSTFWGISGNATSYWLFQGTVPANTANYAPLLEDSKYVNADKTINLPAKKISLSGAFTVFFDDRGIPYSPNSLTALSNNLAFTVNPLSGGATPITITIIPLTGYVQ